LEVVPLGGSREAATARVYWAMAVGMVATLLLFTLGAVANAPRQVQQCAPGVWSFRWWWGAVAVGAGFLFGVLEAGRLRPDGATVSSARGVVAAASVSSALMLLIGAKLIGRAYWALYGGPLRGGPDAPAEMVWLLLPMAAVVALHEACHLAVFRLFGVRARLRVSLSPRIVVATEYDDAAVVPGVLAVALVAPLVILTLLGLVLMSFPSLAPWVAWAVAANWAGSVPDLGRLAMMVAELRLARQKVVGRRGAPATL